MLSELGFGVFIAMGSHLILVSVNDLFFFNLELNLFLLVKWTGLSYLCFCQHERGGHFEALGSGQVLVEFELVLQLQQLLTGEGGAGPPALPQQTRLRARWRRKSRQVINLCVFM